MRSVPRHRTDRHGGERTSHGNAGFRQHVDKHLSVYEQTNIDGVLGPGQLMPGTFDASIKSLINGPATVTVNDDGITIEDGALVLKDEFGETVLVASGWEGSWSDFFQYGLYNGSFTAGSDGAVALGRTSDLPYWTYSTNNTSSVLHHAGGGWVKLTADNAASSRAILTSDPVAVRSGGHYRVRSTVEHNALSGTGSLILGITQFDINGDAIAEDVVYDEVVAGGGFLDDPLTVTSSEIITLYDCYSISVVVRWDWDSGGDADVVVYSAALIATEGGGDAIEDIASASLTLTTTLTAITDADVGLDYGRTYLVIGTFDFNVSVSGVGLCVGELVTAGVSDSSWAIYSPATTGRATITKAWVVTPTAIGTTSYGLQARKTIAAGTAVAALTHTKITAVPLV